MPHVSRRVAWRRRRVPVPGMDVAVLAGLAGYAIGEAAYAKSFQIQTSDDAANWTTIYSTTTGTGGTQTRNVTGSGRYVRMFEFQVYGDTGTGGGCGTTNAALNRPVSASSTENTGTTGTGGTQALNVTGNGPERHRVRPVDVGCVDPVLCGHCFPTTRRPHRTTRTSGSTTCSPCRSAAWAPSTVPVTVIAYP